MEPQSAPVELTANTSADFVVIGAGFAGMAAARRLVQLMPNSRIVVLEAGRFAEGASGRNSGFMIDLPHELTSEDYAGEGDDKKIIRLNRKAIEFVGDAVRDYDISADFFDRAGKVNGAASQAAIRHNINYAAHLRFLGEASQMLDAQQMKEMTGSRHYLGGLYTAGTVMLQPAGLMRGIAGGLKRDGVQLFENSGVIKFSPNKIGWDVKTKNAVVSTPKVILTVNGHLASFGLERGRLMQLFLFANMTPKLDAEALKLLGGHSRWGITPSDPMGTTMRKIDELQGGNRIITRTCAVVRSCMTTRKGDLARAKEVMRRKFDRRFPQLAGLEMEHSWAGHLCLSLNGVSVTREIDKGVFSGCVQNGLGTTRGTLTGIAAAEMAAGTRSEISDHFGNEHRPKCLLPEPFFSFGANSVLRYREWKAGND
ncbi:FAD-dependent oxidoreductase [Cognatishimia sp. WU-CL00825]|uniref:NAD(P)/FAD-dependent oxidoreductase n=1 Tax=Cognatishimia sp. WU-CL00825 TaxID=3127658 RepID=UPI003365A3D6